MKKRKDKLFSQLTVRKILLHSTLLQFLPLINLIAFWVIGLAGVHVMKEEVSYTVISLYCVIERDCNFKFMLL